MTARPRIAVRVTDMEMPSGRRRETGDDGQYADLSCVFAMPAPENEQHAGPYFNMEELTPR